MSLRLHCRNMCQSPLESLLGLALTASGPSPPSLKDPPGEQLPFVTQGRSSTEDSWNSHGRVSLTSVPLLLGTKMLHFMRYVHSILAGKETRGMPHSGGKHCDVSEARTISSSAVSVLASALPKGFHCTLFVSVLSAPERLGKLDRISTFISPCLSVLHLETRPTQN